MSSTAEPLAAIYKLLQCQICTELMSAPFALSCGHTYCYDCAYQWLKTHRTCPTCRQQIRSKPTLIYNLKEVADLVMNFCQDVVSNENSAENLRIVKRQKDDVFQAHASNLFPNLFRDHTRSVAGGRILDVEDHVMRCVRCHWEVEGPECSNCGFSFSQDDPMSGEDFDNLNDTVDEDESEDEGPNEYDLDDSFIVADDAQSSDDDDDDDVDPQVSIGFDHGARVVLSSDGSDPEMLDSPSESHVPRGRLQHVNRLDDEEAVVISSSSSQSDVSHQAYALNGDDANLPMEDTSAASSDESNEFHGFDDGVIGAQDMGQGTIRASRRRRLILDIDSDE